MESKAKQPSGENHEFNERLRAVSPEALRELVNDPTLNDEQAVLLEAFPLKVGGPRAREFEKLLDQ